jgi:murein DD-endopeptidase MepM/ murein hydrolase activator NlpD
LHSQSSQPDPATTRRSRRQRPTAPAHVEGSLTDTSHIGHGTSVPGVTEVGPSLTRRGSRAFAQPKPPAHDAFDAAARLFSFTSEAAKPSATAAEAAIPAPSLAAGSTVLRKHEPHRAGRFKGIAAASFSASVLGIVGLVTVGMTTPAEALPHEHPSPITTTIAGDVLDPTAQEVQAYVTPSDTENFDLARTENYSVASLVNLAGTVGISNFSDSVFANDPSCAIQWPYAVGVPITYGFGMRDGRMHEGTDFIPGGGAQIQAIADGVVRTATDSGGAYGVTIVIDHVVNGQPVSTRYAHMEYDSRQVQVGDTVSVGEYIGRTGNTGRSFGEHLHFELLQNGTTAIDPMPWLRQHASC